jgi:hypothetical protein
MKLCNRTAASHDVSVVAHDITFVVNVKQYGRYDSLTTVCVIFTSRPPPEYYGAERPWYMCHRRRLRLGVSGDCECAVVNHQMACWYNTMEWV